MRGPRRCYNALAGNHMGIHDREYYRDEGAVAPRPKMGRGGKAVMIAAIALFAAQSLYIGDFLATGRMTLENGGWMAQLALHPWALLPVGGESSGWPAPWQVLTSLAVQGGLIEVAMFCIFGLWLMGSMVESKAGTRLFLLLLAASAVLPAILAALIDPLLAPHGVSFGISHASAGIFVAAWQLYPPVKGKGAFSFRTFAIILLVVAAGLSAWTYFPSGRLPGQIHVISSLPALLGAAAVGFVFFRLAAVKRMMPRAEEDFLAALSEHNTRAKGIDFEAIARGGTPGLAPEEALRRQKERDREEKLEAKRKKREQSEQAQLDALLERIGKDGIDSLSRSEKAFLERVSREKRESQGQPKI